MERNEGGMWQYRKCGVRATGIEYPTVSVDGGQLHVSCPPSHPYDQIHGYQTDFLSPLKFTNVSVLMDVDANFACVSGSCSGVVIGSSAPLITSYEQCFLMKPHIPLVRSERQEYPNVMILLLDAVSRFQFARGFPATSKFLEAWEKAGKLFDFSNYGVVGANSGPNQAAFFKGEFVSFKIGSDESSSKSWIWNKLRNDYGYVFGKIDDMCYRHSGLQQSILEDSGQFDFQFLEIFCNPRIRRPNCIGSRYIHEYVFEYLDYVTELASPWGVFVSFGEGHEDSMSLGGIMDSALTKFLGKLESGGVLDNTVLVLMSDHGLHYGSHFQTPMGQTEQMSPFFKLAVPHGLLRRLSEKQVDNLRSNLDKLTSPFDMHWTLLELLVGTPVTGLTGKSLLSERLSLSRSCTEAGIPSEFCLENSSILVNGPIPYLDYEASPTYECHFPQAEIVSPLSFTADHKHVSTSFDCPAEGLPDKLDLKKLNQYLVLVLVSRMMFPTCEPLLLFHTSLCLIWTLCQGDKQEDIYRKL